MPRSETWKFDRRNQVAGQGQPVEELQNWVDRKLQEPALRAITSAAQYIAQGIRQRPGPELPVLLDQDVPGNVLDSSKAPACYYAWEDAGHWSARLKVVNAPPKTDPFCVPMKLIAKQGNNYTLVRIQTDEPPQSRQIEFGPNPRLRDLFHELLHWCCHLRLTPTVQPGNPYDSSGSWF
jgi:hypothetical protein